MVKQECADGTNVQTIVPIYFFVCVLCLAHMCVYECTSIPSWLWPYLLVVAFACSLLTFAVFLMLCVHRFVCECVCVYTCIGVCRDGGGGGAAGQCGKVLYAVISIILTREALCVEAPLNTLQGQTLSPVLLTIACRLLCNTHLNTNTPKSTWPSSSCDIQ